MKDIYQTKLYGDVFNAEYAILVSSESLTREIRDFTKKNNLTNRIQKAVIILKYIEESKEVIIEPKVLEDCAQANSIIMCEMVCCSSFVLFLLCSGCGWPRGSY